MARICDSLQTKLKRKVYFIGSDDELRKISETQYKKIIEMFNTQVDKEVSAMTTVLSSWGRNSEISGLSKSANAKKDEFAKLFQ